MIQILNENSMMFDSSGRHGASDDHKDIEPDKPICEFCDNYAITKADGMQVCQHCLIEIKAENNHYNLTTVILPL